MIGEYAGVANVLLFLTIFLWTPQQVTCVVYIHCMGFSCNAVFVYSCLSWNPDNIMRPKFNSKNFWWVEGEIFNKKDACIIGTWEPLRTWINCIGNACMWHRGSRDELTTSSSEASLVLTAALWLIPKMRRAVFCEFKSYT